MQTMLPIMRITQDVNPYNVEIEDCFPGCINPHVLLAGTEMLVLSEDCWLSEDCVRWNPKMIDDKYTEIDHLTPDLWTWLPMINGEVIDDYLVCTIYVPVSRDVVTQ